MSGAGAAGPAPDAAGAARPVVVFGGTFDPPHRRHVEVLRGVDALLKARQSIVVPAWRNPQREDAGASPADRLAMATLAFAPIADAVVVPWETERGAPCYSIDTVEDVLRRQRAGEVMQGPLRLVVGSVAEYICFERQIHGFITMGRVMREALSGVEVCAQALRRYLKV